MSLCVHINVLLSHWFIPYDVKLILYMLLSWWISSNWVAIYWFDAIGLMLAYIIVRSMAVISPPLVLMLRILRHSVPCGNPLLLQRGKVRLVSKVLSIWSWADCRCYVFPFRIQPYVFVSMAKCIFTAIDVYWTLVLGAFCISMMGRLKFFLFAWLCLYF